MIIGAFKEVQEIAPDREGGIDFGAKGKVLFKYGKIRVVWRSGGSCWAGVGMERSTFHAQLEIIGMHQTLSIVILKGGRLSMNRIKRALPDLKSQLVMPDLKLEHFHPKKTFEVIEVRKVDAKWRTR